ncbi:MAG: OB-fold nucleic acid binding domain-containing protein, partial [Pseudomonadota bacterium]|nr:OB-fold nucleic acid binding domain-containing protein [Pseudomonadota bacterium]
MSGRPELLFPLFADVTKLDGVGPKTAQHLEQIDVTKPRDLLFLLPYSGIDRGLKISVNEAELPGVVTTQVLVGAHRAPRNRGGAYRITVQDALTSFQIVFFHARGDYLKKILPEGARRVVSGKVELFDGVAQMVHPEYVVAPDEAEEIPAFEPIYPLTHGVTQKTMVKAVRSALDRAPEMTEWIDPSQKDKAKWPNWRKAMELVHRPEALEQVSPNHPARERLAYDEFLAH